MSTLGDIAIAFASGGAGGTLTSLVTPWAQWGVDKRRRRKWRPALGSSRMRGRCSTKVKTWTGKTSYATRDANAFDLT